MRSYSKPQAALNPLLSAIVWLAALVGGVPSVGAQEVSTDASSASSVSPAARAGGNAHFAPEDIGDSMLTHRRYQGAIEAYKTAPGDSSAVWNKMGIAYQMLFNTKDAARCYKESLRLDPGNAWALNNLGTVYDSQGDLAGAEALYRKGLMLDPNSARIAMNLGTILMLKKKFREGSDLYRRALALDPDVFNNTGTPISRSGVPVKLRGVVNYYKARGCAQAGRDDCVIRFLGRALAEGFTSSEKVARDRNFSYLHGNPAFQRLIAPEPITAMPSIP